jgi:hypothetical protein
MDECLFRSSSNGRRWYCMVHEAYGHSSTPNVTPLHCEASPDRPAFVADTLAAMVGRVVIEGRVHQVAEDEIAKQIEGALRSCGFRARVMA